MISVIPYGEKWAIAFYGHAHSYLTLRGEVRVWDTREQALHYAEMLISR